jgi:hypothetical protein
MALSAFSLPYGISLAGLSFTSSSIDHTDARSKTSLPSFRNFPIFGFPRRFLIQNDDIEIHQFFGVGT